MDTSVIKESNSVECLELLLNEKDHYKNLNAKIRKINNISFRYVPADEVTQLALKYEADESETSNINKISNTDLIPAVYEGGAKIWECTTFLLKYLSENSIGFTDKVVLDLGCGCGLLGIYAGLQNAKEVHFQDYNKFVLKYSASQNVALNNVNRETAMKYFYGDWDSFRNYAVIEDGYYDYILTSETVYNVESFDKLYNLFVKKLKFNGIIYLIAKLHYFGVGGGTNQFKEYLMDKKTFRCDSIWKSEKGVMCELLRISFSSSTQ